MKQRHSTSLGARRTAKMRLSAALGAMALSGLLLGLGAAAVSAQTGPAPAAGAPTGPAPGAANVQPVPIPQPQAQPQPATPQAAAPAAGLALPPQPPPVAGAAPEQRGFLNGFGAWWNKSVADWKAKMQEQQTKLDAMNKQNADATQQALKSAADALTPSHVIDIHQTCPVAGNGAADCATAASNVCKAKGYSDGQPLDVRTAEKCSDSLWVSGQTPRTADCPVETTLLRAACR